MAVVLVAVVVVVVHSRLFFSVLSSMLVVARVRVSLEV